MTSKLTRERLETLANAEYCKSNPGAWLLGLTEVNKLARMALAALDSEPVAWLLSGGGAKNAVSFDSGNAYADPLREVTPLYRHAQPAPEYPETLPCPVLLEPGMRFGKGVKTRLVLDAIQRRAEHYAELEAMTPEERAEYDASIEAFKAMLPQPAPVVPECFVRFHDIIKERHYGRMPEEVQNAFDECAAMLQAGNSPVIPDGYVMVPKVPSQAHLNSIAMRYRHDFYLLNDAQKDSALAVARQMYEECSGQGFYTYTLPAAPHGTPALNSLQSVDSVAGK